MAAPIEIFQTKVTTAADALALINGVFQWAFGPSEPSITFPFLNWGDTGNDLWKQRNADDNGWIIRGKLSEAYFGLASADILESDGETVKEATHAASADTATLAEAAKGDIRFQVSGTWSAPTTTIAANGELVFSSFTTTIPAGKSLILKMARFIIEVSGSVGFEYIKMTVGCWRAGSYNGNKWISDVRGGEYSPNHILYTNSSDSPVDYYLRVSAFNTDSNSYNIILPTSWWFDIAIE